MHLTAQLSGTGGDSHMAFFDTQGNLLACSENVESRDVEEWMETDTGDLTEVLVFVWMDPAELYPAPGYDLLVTGTRMTEVAEQEPNNAPATAQAIASAIGEVYTVTGAVDSDAGDAEDYFAYSVAEGNTVTVQANLTSVPESLVYLALRTAAGDAITVSGEELSFFYDENATTGSFTYTVPAGMDTLLVLMAGAPGSASYEVTTSIE